jgi:hypothetical protein
MIRLREWRELHEDEHMEHWSGRFGTVEMWAGISMFVIGTLVISQIL